MELWCSGTYLFIKKSDVGIISVANQCNCLINFVVHLNQVGSMGINTDDINSATLLVWHPCGDITTDNIQHDFGLRHTSVGYCKKGREDSTKTYYDDDKNCTSKTTPTTKPTTKQMNTGTPTICKSCNDGYHPFCNLSINCPTTSPTVSRGMFF